MTSTEQEPTSRLNSNDFLFNLSLLNALVWAVAYGLHGASVGSAFLLGLGVFLVAMPVVLSLTYGACRFGHKQHVYVAATNVILLLTLLGGVAVAVLALV